MVEGLTIDKPNTVMKPVKDTRLSPLIDENEEPVETSIYALTSEDKPNLQSDLRYT